MVLGLVHAVPDIGNFFYGLMHFIYYIADDVEDTFRVVQDTAGTVRDTVGIVEDAMGFREDTANHVHRALDNL